MQRGREGRDTRSRGTPELTPDRVFDILESPRRRHALTYLSERDSAVHLDELAAAVAAREHRAGDDADSEGERGAAANRTATETDDRSRPDPDAVDDDVRQQVRLSLYHVHLPKLKAAGLVDFQRGDPLTIELTGDLGPLKPSLDVQQSEQRREYYTN